MKGSVPSFEQDRFRLWCLAVVWGPSMIQPAYKPILGQGKALFCAGGMVLCWAMCPFLSYCQEDIQIAVPFGSLRRESG